MNDLSLVYEHLICKAYKCSRCEIAIANADVYRMATSDEKRTALENYVVASLKAIIIFQTDEYGQIDIETFKYCLEKLKSGVMNVNEVLAKLQYTV